MEDLREYLKRENRLKQKTIDHLCSCGIVDNIEDFRSLIEDLIKKNEKERKEILDPYNFDYNKNKDLEDGYLKDLRVNWPFDLNRECNDGEKVISWEFAIWGGSPPYTVGLRKFLSHKGCIEKTFDNNYVKFEIYEIEFSKTGYYIFEVKDKNNKLYEGIPVLFYVKVNPPDEQQSWMKWFNYFLESKGPKPVISISEENRILEFEEIAMDVIIPEFYDELDEHRGFLLIFDNFYKTFHPYQASDKNEIRLLIQMKTILARRAINRENIDVFRTKPEILKLILTQEKVKFNEDATFEELRVIVLSGLPEMTKSCDKAKYCKKNELNDPDIKISEISTDPRVKKYLEPLGPTVPSNNLGGSKFSITNPVLVERTPDNLLFPLPATNEIPEKIIFPVANRIPQNNNHIKQLLDVPRTPKYSQSLSANNIPNPLRGPSNISEYMMNYPYQTLLMLCESTSYSAVISGGFKIVSIMYDYYSQGKEIKDNFTGKDVLKTVKSALCGGAYGFAISTALTAAHRVAISQSGTLLGSSLSKLVDNSGIILRGMFVCVGILDYVYRSKLKQKEERSWSRFFEEGLIFFVTQGCGLGGSYLMGKGVGNAIGGSKGAFLVTFVTSAIAGIIGSFIGNFITSKIVDKIEKRRVLEKRIEAACYFIGIDPKSYKEIINIAKHRWDFLNQTIQPSRVSDKRIWDAVTDYLQLLYSVSRFLQNPENEFNYNNLDYIVKYQKQK